MTKKTLYINPFEYLDDYINSPEKLDLNQVKKQILLEIHLDIKQRIYLKGALFTKQDILNIFNKIESNEKYFFIKILKNKPLHHFLKFGEILDSDEMPNFHNCWIGDSNYENLLANAFNYYSKNAIIHTNLKELAKVKSIIKFSSDLEKRKSLSRIIAFYEEWINEIKNCTAPKHLQRFKILQNRGFYSLLNSIEEDFYGLTEKVGLEVNNFTVRFGKSDEHFMYLILSAAHSLNCSNTLKKLIISNKYHFASQLNLPFVPSKKQERFKKKFLIAYSFLLIALIIFIYKTLS